MKELHLGEGDMECYITAFRRMSMIDLQYLDDLDDEDDSARNALEIPDMGKNLAGMTNMSPSPHGCNSSSLVSSVNYTAMEDGMS
jgi:hypothetical protein